MREDEAHHADRTRHRRRGGHAERRFASRAAKSWSSSRYNLDGTDRGDPVLALDAVDAGVGDRVLLTTEGFSAMTAVGRPHSPIDMAVIGVIDQIEIVDDAR